jgi:hypothetical protein
MSFAVQDRPLDMPFAQPDFAGAEPGFFASATDGARRAGDVIRSQYSPIPPQFSNNFVTHQSGFGSMFGFFSSANILQQLYQMLQQLFSSQGAGEQYFQNANGGSVGDPHLSFNGSTWNNMGSQPDLLHSDSIPGGYQLSTQTTAPNANGVTYNRSATVTTNNGTTSVTMDNGGNVTISQFGNSFAMQPGQSIDLGNGEFAQRNADGSLQITCNNGAGGNITTTMKCNGNGVDVNASASNVDLGGALVNGPNGLSPLPPPKMPMPHIPRYQRLD